jgi:DNA-binding CsgD family transcriptional regulator
MDPQSFESVLQSISQARTLLEIEDHLREVCRFYALANIGYQAVRIPWVEDESPIFLQTGDDQWVSRYLEQGYIRIDPVVKAGRRGILPIDWLDVDRSSDGARAFFAEANRFGIGPNGISLPIRGANGERAIFTATSSASESAWKIQRIICLRDLQMIGLFVHDRAVRIAGLGPPLPKHPPTEREIQCLEALSTGRMPKQIADDLGISESAVRLYLHAIRVKLDCTTIAQAIVVAISLNIIGS